MGKYFVKLLFGYIFNILVDNEKKLKQVIHYMLLVIFILVGCLTIETLSYSMFRKQVLMVHPNIDNEIYTALKKNKKDRH